MKLGVQRTLDRTIDVLLAFDAEHPEFTVENLAQHLGIPKSTVYRYVRILEEKGLIARTGYNSSYTLGFTILRLARRMRRGNTLLNRSLPYMQELADRVNETVLLVRRDDLDAICLDRVEPRRSGLRISFEPGAVLPTHASAPSKVLLAFSPPDVADRVIERGLERYTAATITEPDGLRHELEQVRALGHAVSVGELDEGAAGIAVPIWGPGRRVVASLSITAPEARVPRPKLLEWLPILERAAREISAGLME